MSGEEMTQDLPSIGSLDELVDLVQDSGESLYVRWSRGPAYDREMQSVDELTGVELPGLSASPLAVESWWEDHPLELWVARRLYDYRHLRDVRGPEVRPWLLRGHELARGPDNEPLVTCDEPVAWLDEAVVRHAAELVEDRAEKWGPLQRF